MITAPHFSGKISSRRETFSITIEVAGQSPEGSGSGDVSGERGQLTGEAGDPRNQGKDDGKRTGSQQEVQIPPLNTHIRAHTHTRVCKHSPRDCPWMPCSRTYTLSIPLDGFFVVPVLQLLPISQEKGLLLLIV